MTRPRPCRSRLEHAAVRGDGLRGDLRLRRGGEHKFVVQAVTPDQLVATDSIVTQAKAVADLRLDVIDPKGPRAVGEPAQYEIHVTNRGTDIARDIRLVAACPPQVEVMGVTGNAVVEARQVFFRPISQLQSGEKIVHKMSVRAQEPGSHLFRVIVQCDDPETRLSSEETTRFFVRPAAEVLATPPAPPESKLLR